MQIREKMFETNSSSTHSISISNRGTYTSLTVDENGIVKLGKHGKTEFGWTGGRIDDPDSRANYAMLQAVYSSVPEYITLVERVILDQTGANEVVDLMSHDYDLPEGKVWAYIDHQSCIYEDDQMEDIFESYDSIRDFIFNTKSFVYLDNDNH